MTDGSEGKAALVDQNLFKDPGLVAGTLAHERLQLNLILEKRELDNSRNILSVFKEA